ncbi:MAG TPA: polysaccharide biosynthesis protein, partial [Flavobacteriaceae bacterium]|nr:polysaccharide biosynthesis protein [Flavobacteriaceae bacterium]
IMLLFRIGVKEVYQYLRNLSSGLTKKKVAIIGVDDDTISLGKAITTESKLPFKLIGFLTQNVDSKRYKILGKPVFPIKNSFSETVGELHLDGVLIVSESFSRTEKNKIVEDCLDLGIEVFNVPSMEKWNKKEDITNQIKPIEIEDLLEREEIKIDDKLIKKDISGKTVMVTGGAGSIG